MIARYTRPDMGAIWSDENKFRTWLLVEVAACEAQAELGRIPTDALYVIKNKADFYIDVSLDDRIAPKHWVLDGWREVGR